MSTVLIFSDYGSFEGNVFFVSQAQRFLVRAILKRGVSQQPWVVSYAEELNLDSWNNELKSFYLRSEEGCFDNDRAVRAAYMISIFEDAVVELRAMNYGEFVRALLELNYFDLADGNVNKNVVFVQFLPGLKLIDEKLALNHIFCIVMNVLKYLKEYDGERKEG